MKLPQILAALPSMSASDLSLLAGAIRQLQGGEPPPTGEERAGGPLFEAVKAVLGAKGLAFSRGDTYANFAKSKQFKAWEEGSERVTDFVRAHFGRLKKVEELRLYKMLLPILLDKLTAQKVPISLGSVCSNIGRLTDTFDIAFPGYIGSGLARVVIKSMRNKG